ncbi:MAG: hypothetical protein WD801_13005 [Gemmatimonadaceae bacterium]
MRLLLVLLAAAMASGCGFWYKPVPVANAVGEERTVLAGDTMHYYPGDRFEVYGPSSEAVYDGYEQLNRAYRAFERYLVTPAPKLAVVLRQDSVHTMDPAVGRAFRGRGLTLLQYERPPSVRSRSRYRGIQYGGVLWPIAPTAVRAMLARLTDDHLGGTSEPDSTLLDRYPLWYRAAVIRVLGDAATYSYDLARVREKQGVLIPFRDLFRLVRSSTADSLIDPSRLVEADEYTDTFAAQAGTLGRYLLEVEGPHVLRTLGAGYLNGRALPDMLAEFTSSINSIDELERRWKIWIGTRE